MESLYTDVLVIGASASGVCAALSAARHGCNVILTEETSWVGGMLSAAGVSAFDGNHLLPSGLFGEFRKHLLQYYGSAQELATGWVSNTHFEPHVAHQILSSMLQEQESIRQYMGYKPIEILKKRDEDVERVVGAVFNSSSQGAIRIEAAVTIFADEFGDCVGLSDLPWHAGLEGRSAFKEELGPEEPLMHPQDFTWTATVVVQQPIQFDQDALQWTRSGEFSQILGSPPISLNRFLAYGALPNQKAMINWPIRGNDFYANYLDPSVDRELLWQKARKKTQRLVHLLQSSLQSGSIVFAEDEYLEKGNSGKSDGLALIPYIREARRIFGIETLTLNDVLKADESPLFEYSIAVGDYPLDHHREQDPECKEIQFPPIQAFGIPYQTLLPKNLEQVLVIEKSISVSGLVNGATRLQPVVMQLGHCAGIAAAMAVKERISPSKINIEDLQYSLLQQNGYLVPTHDVSIDDPDFIPIQLAVLNKVLLLHRLSDNWVNKGFAEPDKDIEYEGERMTRREAARRFFASKYGIPKNK
jgi:hypothetical protein